MALTYDGPVTIAVGSSRRCTSWQNREMYWSELAKRLQTPARTQESLSEYKALPKTRRDEIKDVGGFVGGLLKGGRRKVDAVASRRLLTLDLDSVPRGQDPWATVTLVIGCAAVLYSTHSHSDDAPRLRLILPLSRPVTPDEYTAIAHRVAGDIGIDWCDDTTYEPHRLMYWPSASIDATYRYEMQDGPWLDADEQLARYEDWHDQSQWPVSSRKTDIMRRMAATQGDPTTKPGVVGAFCRVYSVEDAILAFLPEVYAPCASDGSRYSFLGGSTAGGLVLYENGKFAYSHHATDPASGHLCNAFDLVRCHLFTGEDDDIVPGTPVNRLPSYKKMCELALQDEQVRQDLAETKLKEISDAFDDEETDVEWLKTLSVDKTGAFETTVENVLIILNNDPSLVGQFFYDEFRQRMMVTGDLPWIRRADRPSDVWTDADDAGLRMLLEKRYKLDYVRKIDDAVMLAMLQHKRHPVRDYLDGLVWDETPRLETLFIDYMNAEDSPYTRQVTRKALIGAVARIYQPGCKHDHALVLVGPQGCRKSTILGKLGQEWFSDSLFTMTGKEAFEQLQGAWIIELGEMAAARKAEVEQIKLFISKREDSFRAAYARRSQTNPRQCAFFGSTNDMDFLRDQTGARRFWPVEVTSGVRVDDLTKADIDQLWAEAVAAYKGGEQWYLDAETEVQAAEIQAEHTEMSDMQGVVEQFIEKPVPPDWDSWDIDRRRLFWHGTFEDDSSTLLKRNRVCALEIWVELFNGDLKSYSQKTGREINGCLSRCKGWELTRSYTSQIYGRQRGYKRAAEKV